MKAFETITLSKIDQAAVAQEFHISVTPLRGDDYLVRIERVAPGVPLAEEQVSWPVEQWLTQARQLMNDPLLGLLQGNAAFVEDIFYLPDWDEPVSPSSRNLVELGQQLYNALFQGSLRDSWMMAQAIAQNQRQILRLRLGLRGTSLLRLPWEVLHAGDRPLATGTDVAFSRYQLSTGRLNPISSLPLGPNQRLRILMVIASPSDQETLELAEEASHLQEELRGRSPTEPPAIQLTILEQPGREQLTQALEQGQYQVFHYAGHSNLGESGGDVYLVSSKTGLTETLNGEDLAGLLVNNGIQLAVFNSCRGAHTAASELIANGQERNLAEALVRRGIPAVLAMAERIPDEVALTLTRLFYRNLNQGYPIDLSLSRARQGLISAYGSNQLYWALPVLYLHSEFDGFLVNPDTAQSPDQLFALPDPPETSLLGNEEDEALFTAPPRGNTTRFMTAADEAAPFNDEWEDDGYTGFGDNLDLEPSDADDPSVFIKDLLQQLDTQPANGEPPIREIEFTAPPHTSANTGNDPPGEVAVPYPTDAPPDRENPLPPQQRRRTKHPGGLNRWWQTLQRIPKLGLILGAMGILAIAVLGIWVVQSREPRRGWFSQTDSSIPAIPPQTQNVNLATANTATVTSLAIEQLSQGNIASGQKAVEELLNRGALQQADAALAVVPKAQQFDNPEVSFLRGRLAWQSLQVGNQDYNMSDVRRYWETAHKQQPNSAAYLTALGFAYYGEGNYDRANQAWFDALYRLEETQAAANVTADTRQQNLLTIYAGLALGLWKSAQAQPPDKQTSLLNESRKLRQKVMTDDPVNFQPEALGTNASQNWLWTEQAIRDWRSLLATQ